MPATVSAARHSGARMVAPFMSLEGRPDRRLQMASRGSRPGPAEHRPPDCCLVVERSGWEFLRAGPGGAAIGGRERTAVGGRDGGGSGVGGADGGEVRAFGER